MDEVLTIEEIERRFSGEWVLIADPELDDHLAVVQGRVLFHDADRDVVDHKDCELAPRDAAVLYVGPWPRDLAFIL
jgi:hypothetical protein